MNKKEADKVSNRNHDYEKEEKIDRQMTIFDVQEGVTGENGKATKEEFLNVLRFVAPGTNLRAALNGIVDAKKGALILVENEITNELLDGGFKVNCKFTPQRLIELAKMDGGIVLSKDMKRIVYANVTLAPDVRIQTRETGTRHKAAERSAKMAETLAIAISERKNHIHIYYKDLRYFLKDTNEVLRRATETLQIMEKQRELFDLNVDKLNKFEINDDATLRQATKVIQYGKAMEKILDLQEKTFIELGNEASTLKLRIKELMKDVERETDLTIKDYTGIDLKKSKNIINELSYEEVLDANNILLALGQMENNSFDSVEGWRLLSKAGISEKEIAAILQNSQNLRNVLNTKPENYKKILGDEKARIFWKDLQRIINSHK